MKPGYEALIPLIKNATELPYAECFTLTLQDGTVLRYTDLDVPVWLNGQYFQANAVRIQGLKFKQTVGVDIDEQEVDIIATGADTIKGVPVLQAIRERVLDGCTLQRDRAFFDPAKWPPSHMAGAIAEGGVTLFVGRVATVTALGRTTAKVNVKSNFVLLDVDYPRNVFQASCLHTLYDSGCTLNKAAYQSFGTVGAGATYTVLPVTLGGSGAVLQVNMSGGAGAPILKVALTSPQAVNMGYGTTPPVTVTDPTGSGAVLRALMAPFPFFGSSGMLYGIQVVEPGANYTNPVVTIGPGSAGTATAQAVLAGGGQSVASVSVLQGGLNFSGATQIVFSGGGGTGVAATPVISGGVITGVKMVDGGTAFLTAPTATAVDGNFANFAQGSLMFQGGQNAGVLVQIKNATATELVLAQPLDYVPAQGDAFTLWPGCDHTLGAGGCAKFNNQANFRGFPWVPPAETAY